RQATATTPGSGVLRPASRRRALEPKRAPAPADASTFSKETRHMSRSRRPGKFVRFANALISLIVLLVVVGGGLLYFGRSSFESTGPLTTQVVIDIQPKTRLSQIAAQLEEQGVISDATVFLVGVVLSSQSSKLKAGEYAIPAGASMSNVMDILVQGKARLYKVTIPEGRTSQQIVEKLNADPVLTGAIEVIPPEGSLLPETYSFPRGITRAQVLQEMATAQQKLLDAAWEKRAANLPFTSKAQAMILASIIEKETGVKSERSLVASVFVNRLRRGMRLQSDPTIIYGLVGGKGSLGRPILQSEINRETPYNTYKINGLPPTPITNPGRAAIVATLNPADSSYLFFVADGTGGHAFATTLAEHTRNVTKWRQVERQRQAQEKARAAQQPAQPPTQVPVVDPNPAGLANSGEIKTQTQELPLPGQ
ncbi:MAG: endolytic transglycosylase MltG, partial [Hyphomicrobiales bacterium]